MTEEVIIKQGSTLSNEELNQINDSLNREFTFSSQPREFLKDRLFFLLKDKDRIIAFCALADVKPVIFNNEEFSLKGVVHVVSNIKGKGYGRKVIISMMEYLRLEGVTGIGFTHTKNKGFYEKCGCVFPSAHTDRFVAKTGEKNEDGQIIFYIDGKDYFMEKVLANPNENIILPRANLW